MLGLAGLCEYGVAVALIGDNYVLVSNEILHRKADHIVGVELADGLDSDVYFVGGGVWE